MNESKDPVKDVSDRELEAMSSIVLALKGMPEESRVSVVRWLAARYLGSTEGRRDEQSTSALSGAARERSVQSSDVMADRDVHDADIIVDGKRKEWPGIAHLNEAGELRLLARDLKANSANDAAIRIVHIAALAHSRLTGETGVSSRKVVKPILEEWRCYYGSTRSVIASHKGIRREGDLLMLDAHSKREAEQYVREVLDDSIEGKWSPSSPSRRRKRKSKVVDDSTEVSTD